MKVGRFIQFLFFQPQVEHTQRLSRSSFRRERACWPQADSVQKIMMSFARSTLFSKLFPTPAELNFLCACCRFFPTEYTKAVDVVAPRSTLYDLTSGSLQIAYERLSLPQFGSTAPKQGRATNETKTFVALKAPL